MPSICKGSNCTNGKIASFGYLNDYKAIRCKDCKTTDMIDVRHKICDYPNCNNYATCGYPDSIATHGFKQAIWCEDQDLRSASPAHENSTNLIEQECSNCHLLNIIRPDGMCEYCSDWTHNSRVRLGKQYAVEQYLKHNDIQWTLSDQKIPNSINALERPDFLFDYDDYAIILEVDEHQHLERQCEAVGGPKVLVSKNVC